MFVAGHKRDRSDRVKGFKLQVKEGSLIKLRNASNSELEGLSEDHESVSPRNKNSVLGKRNAEDIASRRSKQASMGDVSVSGDLVDDSSNLPSVSEAPAKERKPFLKFKIPKNLNNGNSNLSIGTLDSLPPPPGKDELTYTRGQRSKRRRPAVGDEDSSQTREDSTIKDFSDANWILQKLGKGAAGKRVEVHQPSSNSW